MNNLPYGFYTFCKANIHCMVIPTRGMLCISSLAVIGMDVLIRSTRFPNSS